MPVRFAAQRTTLVVEQFDGPDNGLMPPLSIYADQRGGGAVFNGKPSLDVSEAAVQLTRGVAGWGPLGQATTVTYAFRSSASVLPNNVQGFSNFSAVQIQTTLNALQSWSDVAGIVFQRQDDGSGYSNNATILFGNYSSGADGAGAFAYTPGSRATSSEAGDVWVNISQTNNNNSLPLWGYGTLTLVHEIGHAIGLRHPADYNASAGVTITYAADATYAEDSNQYTVMSYFRETVTGATYGAGRYAAAPLLDDIAAAQRLYGANMSTRTGDTTYGFNSTADRAWFSATLSASTPIFAVWDAGGVDTFDFSGYNVAQLIDLRQGSFSNLGALIGNVSIAIGAVIENAIGGAGNDTIYGNSADNRIAPGAGNNQVDGGLGIDTLVFSGARSSYTITITGREGFITGAEGTTRFLNVEFLAFSDLTIAAPAGTGALTLSGDMTNDTIDGSEFGDTLFGGGGDDVINGLAGNDQLTGGRGNDTLNGGGGDDLLYIDQGNDILAGGEGVDTFDASAARGGLRIDLQLGTIARGGMGTDSVSGIERVIGSRFNDVIVGGAEDNYLAANGGNDTLRGGGGNDELVASAADAGGGVDVLKLFDEANSSIASAVSLDPAFARLARDGVLDAEVTPHATVVAETHGGLEYYAFTVGANTTVTFDIDGAAFDSTLRVFNAAGTELADNDDAQYALDVGPATDSFLTYTFAQAGTYYVQVGQYASSSNAAYATTPAPPGLTYTLHISVPGHAIQPTTLLGSQLFGDAGDDILRSSLGSDVLDGGIGTDTAVFAGNRASYTVTVSGGVTTVSNAEGTDTVTNVERLQFADMVTNAAGVLEVSQITGTVNADTLNGSSGPDVINGLDGNDTINGLGGDDVIDGGAGNDTLSGGAGNDTLTGGSGIDTADYSMAVAGITARLDIGVASNDGDGGSDILSGIENLTGSAYDDLLFGNAGANVLQGTLGRDTIIALGGDDVIMGGAGVPNELYGGTGNDTYIVESRFDTIIENAGEGIDTVVSGIFQINLSANVENLTYNGTGNFTGVGNGEANVITGGTFRDVLAGLSGDDILIGGSGEANELYGGTGNDTFIMDVGDTVIENEGEGIDTVQLRGLHTHTLRANVDNLTVIGTGDYVANGNALNNVLTGGTGNDSLAGAGGDDTLVGGAGIDTLSGEAGIDTADYSAAAGAITARLDIGAASNDGDGGSDILSEIENLTGSAFDDLLFGNSAGNVLRGGQGRDVIIGLGGDDMIMGGAGAANEIYGGTGNDTYLVESRFDTIIENAGEGIDTVVSGIFQINLSANVENLTYNGTGNFTGVGNGEANVITGGIFRDVLAGLSGDDILIGGSGEANELYGGTGNDTFIMDVGDTVIENEGEGIDTVQLRGLHTHTLRANVDNLTVIGTGDYVASGNALNNVLTGGTGNDTLFGAGGDDTLNGEAGNDIAVLSGVRADYTITAISGGWTVTDKTAGRDGTDTLVGVEQLRFSDGTLFTLGSSAQTAIHAPGLSDKDGSGLDPTGGGPDIFPAVPGADILGTPGDEFLPLSDGPWVMALPLDGSTEGFALDNQDATVGGGGDHRWMLTLLLSPDGQVGHPWSGHPGTGSQQERAFTPEVPASTTFNAPVPFDKDGFGLDPTGAGPDIFPAVPGADIPGTPGDEFLPLPDGPWVMALPLDGATGGFGLDNQDATFGGGGDPLWMLTLLPSPDGQVGDPLSGHLRTGTDHWH